jgi:hypothetical protein
MPLFFRPRRPLLRGAMIGGGAYLAGRAGARAQERNYEAQAAEADQTERIAELESNQAPAYQPPPPAAASGGGSDMVEQLTKLKGLLDAGALTQEEFQTAKQRLLAGA